MFNRKTYARGQLEELHSEEKVVEQEIYNLINALEERLSIGFFKREWYDIKEIKRLVSLLEQNQLKLAELTAQISDLKAEFDL